MYSFIQVYVEYVYMLGTVLGLKGAAMNKTDKGPALMELTFWGGDNKQVNQ